MDNGAFYFIQVMNISKLYNIFKESTGITTDSRTIEKDSIFFSIKGEHFDGNKYAGEALDKGAKYAVIDNQEYCKNVRCLLVDNALKTLHLLASYHIQQLKPQIKVLGLTGSNGKTTTKELLSAVLCKKFKVGFTKGNLNNHLGVPLTILSLNDKHEMAIVEMGANHVGEIHTLAEIARPDYGLITNIGKAHLEGFGSVENIIKGKTELFRYLYKKNGTCFINMDNSHLRTYSDSLKCAKIYYGNTENSYARGFIKSNHSPFLITEYSYGDEKHEINTRLIGDYNLDNVNAAVAVGTYFGIGFPQIKESIEAYIPSNNRSQFIDTGSNHIVLDAYNANPSSMEASIRNFMSRSGKNKTVILGEMNELGDYSYEAHKKIVEIVRSDNLKIILIGEGFEPFHQISGIFYFKNTQKLIEWIKFNRFFDAEILIKGSRTNQLEKIVEYL